MSIDKIKNTMNKAILGFIKVYSNNGIPTKFPKRGIIK